MRIVNFSHVDVGAVPQSGRNGKPTNLYLDPVECAKAETNAAKRYDGMSLSTLVRELMKLENASKRGLLAGRVAKRRVAR